MLLREKNLHFLMFDFDPPQILTSVTSIFKKKKKMVNNMKVKKQTRNLWECNAQFARRSSISFIGGTKILSKFFILCVSQPCRLICTLICFSPDMLHARFHTSLSLGSCSFNKSAAQVVFFFFLSIYLVDSVLAFTLNENSCPAFLLH